MKEIKASSPVLTSSTDTSSPVLDSYFKQVSKQYDGSRADLRREAEDAFILRIAKDKEKKEEDIAKARQRFKESQTNKNIDDLLFDTLTLSDKAANENVAKAMKESELEEDENKLIDSVKKISLENTNEDIDYYSIPSIQTALEFGFSLDDAIIAYSLYGNKSDLMLQYLYSLNMNN